MTKARLDLLPNKTKVYQFSFELCGQWHLQLVEFRDKRHMMNFRRWLTMAGFDFGPLP